MSLSSPRAVRLAGLLAAAAAGCGPPAGPSWTTPVTGLDRAVLSAWGAGPRDVWFAGGGLGSGPGALVLHFDGDAFVEETPMALSATLWWVFGLSSDDLYFCGEGGNILHRTGGAFAPMKSGTSYTLYGLWGTSDSNLWAVGGAPGQAGVLLHFDGNAWAPAAGAPASTKSYFKVWGSAADDVWVVGQGGTILHFDGQAWTSMTSGVMDVMNTTLLTVTGRARDDVWAVGGFGQGVALHWDGTSWSHVAQLEVDTIEGLAGISEDAAGDVVTDGLGGAKLRRSGGTWSDDTAVPPTNDFHGAWLDGPEDAFAVGGNYIPPAPAARRGVIAHYGATLPSVIR